MFNCQLFITSVIVNAMLVLGGCLEKNNDVNSTRYDIISKIG